MSGGDSTGTVKMAELGRLAHEGETSKLTQHLLKISSSEDHEISKQQDWINKPDESGRSLLHWAAAGGHIDIVRLLIDTYNADPDLKDESGWTPLLISASAGRLPVVEMLIGCGVDVNSVNTTGHSALHYAASNNRLEIAQLLIKHGSNVNTLDHMSSTALHRSSSLGYTSISSLLINSGANVHAVNNDGNTPLHLASEEAREADIQLLVKSGARLDCLNKVEAGHHKDGADVTSPAAISKDLFSGPPSKRARTTGEQADSSIKTVEDRGAETVESPEAGASSCAGARPIDASGPSNRIDSGSTAAAAEPQQRDVTLYAWKTGFSVDEGPLREFNSPEAHSFWDALMRMKGEVPRELIRAARDAEVSLNMVDKTTEDYVAPKRKIQSFSGEGHRLGRPCEPVGLENLINTCYINVVLQVMFNVTVLRQTIPQAQAASDTVMGELQLLMNMYGSGKVYLKPAQFKAAVGARSKRFAGEDQQDAAEFLMFLINIVRESLQDTTAEHSIEDIFISLPVDFTEESLRICEGCKHQATTRHLCYILPVPAGVKKARKAPKVSRFHYLRTVFSMFTGGPLDEPDKRENSSDLEGLVAAVVQPEFLEAGTWTCGACGTKESRAVKSVSFTNLPAVLALQLMRYSYNRAESRVDKDASLLTYPLRDAPVGQWLGCADSALYDLVAVINHLGDTAASGHYYAYVLAQGIWYECNDSRVTMMEEESVVTAEAYLLFYERRESGASGTDPSKSAEIKSKNNSVSLVKSTSLLPR